MGSLICGNQVAETPLPTEQQTISAPSTAKPEKCSAEISAKTIIQMIINHWVRISNVNQYQIMPMDALELVTDTFLYQPSFDHRKELKSVSVLAPLQLSFNIVVMGNRKVGKTTLIDNFIKPSMIYHADDFFKKGVVFISGKKCILNIYELYQNGIRQTMSGYTAQHQIDRLLQNAHAAIICYDIMNKKSLKSVSMWNKDCHQPYIKALVGLNINMDVNENRECERDDVLNMVEICKFDIEEEIYVQNEGEARELFVTVAKDINRLMLHRRECPFFG